MDVTIDNALDITKKATYRLFYKKYRGYLKDWDEFYSDAQLLVFQKFAKFDPEIGSFEGYINMYVEYAAIRLLSAKKKRANRGSIEHLGTIEDVSIFYKEVPEELDFILRRAAEIAQEPGMKRSDSIRKRLKNELKKSGWSPEKVTRAFQEINDAIGGTCIRSYAKKVDG